MEEYNGFLLACIAWSRLLAGMELNKETAACCGTVACLECASMMSTALLMPSSFSRPACYSIAVCPTMSCTTAAVVLGMNKNEKSEKKNQNIEKQEEKKRRNQKIRRKKEEKDYTRCSRGNSCSSHSGAVAKAGIVATRWMLATLHCCIQFGVSCCCVVTAGPQKPSCACR